MQLVLQVKTSLFLTRNIDYERSLEAAHRANGSPQPKYI